MPVTDDGRVTENQGPRRLSDDAELFAIALVKVRITAGAQSEAARPCGELLDRFEERHGERGLRVLTACLVELTAGLAGGRLTALERLEQIEMETLARQQRPGRPPGL